MRFFFSLLLILLLLGYFGECAGKYIILTSDQPPLSMCTPKVSVKKEEFSGLEIGLFMNITRRLNWSDNDWDFVCLSNDNKTSQIENYKEREFVAYLGGMQISYDLQNKGFTFSIPTFDSGLSILVLKEKDPWSMIKVFTMNIALIIVGSSLAMGKFFEVK